MHLRHIRLCAQISLNVQQPRAMFRMIRHPEDTILADIFDLFFYQPGMHHSSTSSPHIHMTLSLRKLQNGRQAPEPISCHSVGVRMMLMLCLFQTPLSNPAAQPSQEPCPDLLALLQVQLDLPPAAQQLCYSMLQKQMRALRWQKKPDALN